jgi:dTDP-4-amino-4,6-dideoxygalactose transaminase
MRSLFLALTIIMDAYTVIHHVGAPVFADVDETTHLITAEEIQKKVTP